MYSEERRNVLLTRGPLNRKGFQQNVRGVVYIAGIVFYCNDLIIFPHIVTDMDPQSDSFSRERAS
jgi:hypothetical protein